MKDLSGRINNLGNMWILMVLIFNVFRIYVSGKKIFKIYGYFDV